MLSHMGGTKEATKAYTAMQRQHLKDVDKFKGRFSLERALANFTATSSCSYIRLNGVTPALGHWVRVGKGAVLPRAVDRSGPGHLGKGGVTLNLLSIASHYGLADIDVVGLRPVASLLD